MEEFVPEGVRRLAKFTWEHSMRGKNRYRLGRAYLQNVASASKK